MLIISGCFDIFFKELFMSLQSAKFAKTDNGAITLKPSLTNAVVNQPLALSKEQMRVLDIVKQGYSVFFTGSAGTGKSFLLRRIIGKTKLLLGCNLGLHFFKL